MFVFVCALVGIYVFVHEYTSVHRWTRVCLYILSRVHVCDYSIIVFNRIEEVQSN